MSTASLPTWSLTVSPEPSDTEPDGTATLVVVELSVEDPLVSSYRKVLLSVWPALPGTPPVSLSKLVTNVLVWAVPLTVIPISGSPATFTSSLNVAISSML